MTIIFLLALDRDPVALLGTHAGHAACSFTWNVVIVFTGVLAVHPALLQNDTS